MERTKLKRIGSPGDLDAVVLPAKPLEEQLPPCEPVAAQSASLAAERAVSSPDAFARAMAGVPSMTARMHTLRAKALTECRQATFWTALFSTGLWMVLVVGWLMGMAGLVEMLLWSLSGYVPSDFSVLPEIWNIVLVAVVCLAAPLLIVHVGYTMLASRKLAGWAYVDCLRGLVHSGHGLLFTDEGMQHALQEIQGEHWVESLLPEAQAGHFEQCLERASENFAAARLLPGGTEAEIMKQLLSRRWRQRRYFFFRLPFWVWLACVFIPPVGIPLLAAGASTYIFLGPRYIVSRARLLAFIDNYLDKPKANVAKLGPPAEPPGWWDRLMAPLREVVNVRLW